MIKLFPYVNTTDSNAILYYHIVPLRPSGYCKIDNWFIALDNKTYTILLHGGNGERSFCLCKLKFSQFKCVLKHIVANVFQYFS